MRGLKSPTSVCNPPQILSTSQSTVSISAKKRLDAPKHQFTDRSNLEGSVSGNDTKRSTTSAKNNFLRPTSSFNQKVFTGQQPSQSYLNKINSLTKKGSAISKKSMLQSYSSNKSAGRAIEREKLRKEKVFVQPKSFIQNMAESSPQKSHGYQYQNA